MRGVTSGLLVGILVLALVTSVRERERTPRLGPQRLLDRGSPARELLVVFLVSANCGATQSPDLRDLAPKLWASLKRIGSAEGKRVISIGVSVDADPDQGLRVLRQFGPFDEVIAGGGWVNAGSSLFLLGSVAGPQAVPQLVLLEREVRREGGLQNPSVPALVTRRVGLERIIDYAQRVGGLKIGTS